MPTFSRKSGRRSQGADALSISRTSRTARSAPSTTRSCALATFTRSESRMSVIRDGIRFASFRQRASLTISLRSHVSLSLSQITRLAGTAASCFFTSVTTQAGTRGCQPARHNNGGLLSSSCTISWRREAGSPTANFRRMSYFRLSKYGQTRHTPRRRTAFGRSTRRSLGRGVRRVRVWSLDAIFLRLTRTRLVFWARWWEILRVTTATVDE